MIGNRDRLAKTPADETGLKCIEAGIEATRATRVMNEALERTRAELTVGEPTVDLDKYREVVIVGGGKATAQMATVIKDVLGDQLTDGVVTNDPQETSQVAVVEGAIRRRTKPARRERGACSHSPTTPPKRRSYCV